MKKTAKKPSDKLPASDVLPSAGGSYIRNADGTLTLNVPAQTTQKPADSLAEESRSN